MTGKRHSCSFPIEITQAERKF